MVNDVRWLQRLENYQEALEWLEKTLAIPALDKIEHTGVVQFFEMTFELGWNVAKD